MDVVGFILGGEVDFGDEIGEGVHVGFVFAPMISHC